MNIHFVTDEKIAETSSKGNQEKWKDGNRWYKLDQFGYEALAESAVSCFLEQSNIETDTSFHFTRYRMERMNVHGRDRTGCSSENFLRPGQSIITLSRLFRKNNIDLKTALTRLPSDVRRISYLADLYENCMDLSCAFTSSAAPRYAMCFSLCFPITLREIVGSSLTG